MSSADYFTFFGLDQRLSLDLVDLERRFYRLSRQLHPDRYLRASAAERQKALETSAVLNDAYRTLRDPIARAEYLLTLHGILPGAQQAPPELLEEVFELNEALEDARSEEVERWRGKFLARLRQTDARLEQVFLDYDAARRPEALDQMRELLNRRKYLAKLLNWIPLSDL